MFDNRMFSVSVVALFIIAVLVFWLAVVVLRDVRWGLQQDPPRRDTSEVVLVVSLVLVGGLFLFFSWASAGGKYIRHTQALAVQAQLHEHLGVLQDDLGINDWTRDRATFHTTEFASGQIVVRDEGCRIRVNFMTNSEGDYAIVVGSGVPEGDAEAIELSDGTFLLHSEEECEQIARVWAG